MPKFPLTFLIAALLPLTGFALEPVRVVATGGRIGYTFYSPATGLTSFRQRTPHKLGGPVAEIQIGFMDWMYPDNTGETPNATNNVTLEYAWLERASTAQVIPLTFGGNRQLILPMNSTTPYWLSDVIPSTAWTGNPPAKDDVFWLHVKGSIPTGGKTPVGTPAAYAGARCLFYPPANDPGTLDTAGPIANITGSAGRPEALPLVFLGRYTGPGHLAVIGIGDSILNGSGDGANPVQTISGYGFFNRAAVDENGNNTIATFNLTRHGQTAFSWINPGRQTRQAPFLKFANVVVEEYGTNDLASAGSGDPAIILARLDTIWTTAKNAGVQKIVRTLLMPRTAATTEAPWTNLEAQTPNTGWGTGEKRDQINAGLIAARNAGKVDAIIDTLAVVGDPTDPSRWLTNGTARYLTTDGTHVSAAGNRLLAAPLRASLLSLTVDDNRPDYAAWSSGVDWQTADSAPAADPNKDGITNLLAYALRLPPLGSAAGLLPTAALDTTSVGGPWLTFTYRQNSTAMDLDFIVETSTDLVTWTPMVPDGTHTIRETLNPDIDGNGTAALRQMRLKKLPGHDSRFIRIRIRY